jgi:hypothetical protein
MDNLVVRLYHHKVFLGEQPGGSTNGPHGVGPESSCNEAGVDVGMCVPAFFKFVGRQGCRGKNAWLLRQA